MELWCVAWPYRWKIKGDIVTTSEKVRFESALSLQDGVSGGGTGRSKCLSNCSQMKEEYGVDV